MRQTRWTALRWGGIFGGVAVALAAVHEALAGTVLDGTLAVTLLAGVGFFLIYLVLFFAAGALAARETGLIRAGVVAGLFAALIACAASLLFAVVHTILLQRSNAVSPVQYALKLVEEASGLFLAVLVVFLVFGAGFGTLGGIAGRPLVPAQPAEASGHPAIFVGAPEGALDAPTVASPLDAKTIASALPADADSAAFAAPGAQKAPLPDAERGT